MRTLIKNGTVVTASDTNKTDVLIEGEKIAAIGSGLEAKADQVIDAENRYVMPGAIDVHTHMELPFGGTFASDDFATGTAAAAWGGTTAIVDFAVQTFGQGLRQGLDQWHKKAEGKAHIDYGFHMIVREINDSILTEMDALVNEGVPSFKLFMAYPGVFMLDDASIFRAMSRTAANGGLIMMHAENGGAIDVLVKRYLAEGKGDPINHGLTRPATMEGEATGRAIALSRLAEVAVYIVHLSSKEALDAVREARDDGAPTFAETCPQYLYLSLDDLARPGFEGAKYVCSPPLRRAGRDGAREDVRSLPTQGHDRPGERRRHRHLQPEGGTGAFGEDPSHERGLQLLRGHDGKGPAGGRDAARQHPGPRRQVPGRQGRRPVPSALAISWGAGE